MDEKKKSEIKDLLARITELIEEVLDEKDTVEEISTGVGLGGAPGGSSFFDDLPGKKDSKRRRYRTYTPENKKR
jgi:hypothetical protein